MRLDIKQLDSLVLLLERNGIFADYDLCETVEDFMQLLHRYGLHKREEVELLELADILLLLDAYGIRPLTPTPTAIMFQEITMLDTVGGNTPVYTGTFLPTGAAIPGAQLAVSSNDPAVVPTAALSADATTVTVTVPLPNGWVESTTTPLQISFTATGITPVPSTNPTSLSATITPSAPPPPPTPSPTSITFVQTT